MLTFDLIKNYFLVATRNLHKNLFYSTISILSITIGIVISILVLQYYFFENNYDNYHQEPDQLYRINTAIYEPSGALTREQAINLPGLSPVLRSEIPQVESSVYLMGPMRSTMRLGEDVFLEREHYYSENASIFEIFNFNIISGNPEDLDNPNTIFISQTMVDTYFPDEDPFGKTLEYRNALQEWESYEIRGVYEDVASNSQLIPNALMHGGNVIRDLVNSGAVGPIPYDDIIWRMYNNYTYVRLQENTNMQLFQTQLDQIAETYRAPFDQRSGIVTKFSPQAVTRIHTTLGVERSPGEIVDPSNLRFMFWVGMAALIIGWINYVNLATARSLSRAKEIGIRKYIGSSKSQLIIQFLFESLILNVLALILSVLTILSVIPFYHEMVGQDIFNYFFDFIGYWAIYLAALFVGMIATGFYPALILSNFKPVKVLRGSFKNKTEGALTRKGLVVTQFAIATFLILVIVTIFNQLMFLKGLDTGLNIERSFYVNSPSDLQNNEVERYETFKQVLESNPNIEQVVNATTLPGWENIVSFNGSRIDPSEETESITISLIRAQDDYFNHFDIDVVAGRALDSDRQTDMRRGVLNETAVRSLGFNNVEDAIGALIVRTIGDSVEVVGVVEDYAQRTMQYEQIPIMFQLPVSSGLLAGFGATSLKIVGDNISETTAFIEATFNEHFPGSFYNGGIFLEDEYWNQFDEQDRFANIISAFTIFSVLISILGLLGLSTFMIEQRLKEISIRKVLGSSGNQIMILIYKDYLKLVVISAIIAIPLGIFWVRDWLSDFPIRIEPGAIIITITMITIILITSASISHQTLKALRTNPVNNLRKE